LNRLPESMALSFLRPVRLMFTVGDLRLVRQPSGIPPQRLESLTTARVAPDATSHSERKRLLGIPLPNPSLYAGQRPCPSTSVAPSITFTTRATGLPVMAPPCPSVNLAQISPSSSVRLTRAQPRSQLAGAAVCVWPFPLSASCSGVLPGPREPADRFFGLSIDNHIDLSRSLVPKITLSRSLVPNSPCQLPSSFCGPWLVGLWLATVISPSLVALGSVSIKSFGIDRQSLPQRIPCGNLTSWSSLIPVDILLTTYTWVSLVLGPEHQKFSNN